MRKDKDAYGQVFTSYLDGGEPYAIIERDDGVFTVDNISRYFFEYRNWSPREKQAIRFAKGRVLDIGCSAGRIGLYLQEKKMDVTSIDNSPLAIGVCRKRGLKKAQILGIEKIGAFAKGKFTTILLLGNNFGLLGNRKKANNILKILYRITTPDAIILGSSANPRESDKFKMPKAQKGRMPGQLRIRVRFRNVVGEWFDYLFVSRAEMEKLLSHTGWHAKTYISNNKPGYSYIAVIEKSKKT